MKKLLSISLLGSLLMLGACSGDDPASPAQSISGSVVINGEPVNAAAVLLTPGGGTSITGSDGAYEFHNVKPGNYEIRVYKDGCLPFNRSISLAEGTNETLVLTLSENHGDLTLNKGFIDMGSNDGNNLAAFTITNTSNHTVAWDVTKASRWIKEVKPSSGELIAGGSAAVTMTINRQNLSPNTNDNHTTLVVKSTSDGNGSTAELLITAFGKGNGTNTENDNSDLDFVIIGNLAVQTKDMSESAVNWDSADVLCAGSIIGGFSDWRLPTRVELATLYEQRKAIGGFKDNLYWTSDKNGGGHYAFDFSKGAYGSYINNARHYVRAVRTITE